MMLGTKVLDCHHGKDRNIKLKELNKKKKESSWVRGSSFFFNSLLGKVLQRGVKNREKICSLRGC